jgi:LacI family transcriptional regulator
VLFKKFCIFALMENKKSVKNIRELAAILNLSVTTVSRVLNGKADVYRISPVTSKRVMDVAREMNYFPNKIARGLKLERTDTLGLIIPDVANPFFASIAKTIELEARKNGYSLILCDSLDDIDTETELLQLLAGRKVDGIIIAPVGLGKSHIVNIQQAGIPLVVVDRYFPGSNIPYITSDNYKGAFKAVEHIILNGHKRIACIQGIRGISANTERVKGYEDAHLKYNIPFDHGLIVGDDFGEENGYIQTRILLNRKNKPTAIFALSNLISLGIIRALSETGLSIPDDISLVSFDEQPYSAFLASPMTTIEQRREEIGRMSVSVLLEIINNNGAQHDVNIMLEPRLIIRNSVKKLIG